MRGNGPPDAPRLSRRVLREPHPGEGRSARRSSDTVHPRVAETAMLQEDMTKTFSPLAHLSDDELLEEVRRLAQGERQATAQLIASLAELDARRLYLGQGCSSLFTYCTQVLRLSEHAAYGRIEAARAARRFPVVVELLANGSVNLTTVGVLAPHLTPQNHRELLDSACHKSKRDVEHMVACLRPQPPVRSTVRKLPSPRAPEAIRLGRSLSRTMRRCPRRRALRLHRLVQQLSAHSRRIGTKFSSRCRATRTRNCAGCRTSCGTRFRAVTRLRSSIGH